LDKNCGCYCGRKVCADIYRQTDRETYRQTDMNCIGQTKNSKTVHENNPMDKVPTVYGVKDFRSKSEKN